jgi:Gamma-glutamyltranspeptidase
VRLTQNWRLAKPAAAGQRGVVAAQEKSAAEAGAAILAEGGSAVDAAVAAAFALAAVEPWNSGLGSVGFLVAWPAGTAHAEVVDFGPVAPQALDPAAYPLTGATRTELFTWPAVAQDRNAEGPLSFRPSPPSASAPPPTPLISPLSPPCCGQPGASGSQRWARPKRCRPRRRTSPRSTATAASPR